MITVSDEEAPRRKRTVEIALVGSMLVHLLLALFYFQGTALLTKLHVPIPMPRPQPTEEVITTSSAITLDKRPRPKPVPVQAQPRAQQPQQRSPQTPPNPATVARAQLEAPAIPLPSKMRNELSKNVPAAPPIPPKTRRERQVTETPTAPPTRAHTPAPGERIAFQQRTKAQLRAAQQTHNPSQPSQLSEQQIEKIEGDLSRTIAQARSDTNPLRVPQQPPAAPKHYGIQMQGAAGNLRSPQGVCDPIRESWQDRGFNFYWVACNVLMPSGLIERQAMPWPVHFRPNHDPFNGSMTPEQVQRMPVPGPEPGFKLPPGTTTTKEMRDYAREFGVEI